MALDHKDRVSDFAFRVMTAPFRPADLVYPSVDRRTKGFNLSEGLTVVDYGCEPGRYTRRFAKIVGQQDLV